MARPASTHDFNLVTAPHHDETVEALEHRIRRLEDAIAALQDTQLIEDRVVERVRQRVELHHVENPRPAGGFRSPRSSARAAAARAARPAPPRRCT